MTTQATYTLFAKFYDAYVGHYAQDIPLYLALTDSCRSPVLEIGCGSGRVFLPLLRAGLTVTGVDISDEMLQLAKVKLDQEHQGKFKLLHHNFVDGPLPGKYGLALVTFYTFNYLLSREEQLAFLQHTTESLEPGAKIALHLFHPSVLSNPEMAGQWVDKGNYRIEGEEVHLTDRREMLDSCMEERVQVFAFGADRREEIRTIRRYVTEGEVADLLIAAGFESPKVTMDFDLQNLREPGSKTSQPGDFLVIAENRH